MLVALAVDTAVTGRTDPAHGGAPLYNASKGSDVRKYGYVTEAARQAEGRVTKQAAIEFRDAGESRQTGSLPLISCIQ